MTQSSFPLRDLNVNFLYVYIYLKVPSGQKWYHWIGLEMDIKHIRFFLFFIFDLEYLIRVQISKLLHAKMIQPPTSNRDLSRQTML
jgi:hypothetical protein